MPINVAQKRLEEAGFTLKINNKDYSYAQKVQFEIAQAGGGKAPDYQAAIGNQTWVKGGEKVFVKFAQVPEGTVVGFVNYHAVAAVQKFGQMMAVLNGRYGSPTFKDKYGEPWWCKRLFKPQRCGNDQVSLHAGSVSSGETYLYLSGPSGFKEALQRKIQEDAIARRQGSASF